MNSKRKSNLIANISFGLLVVCLLIVSANISKAADVKKAIKIKPDIVIKDFIVVPTITPGDGDLPMSITVYLWNSRKDTSTGSFKVLVEWTEPPSGSWNRLGVKRISNLKNSSAMAKLDVKSFTLPHTIPAGSTYKYRVTVDIFNKVKEGTKGELNNQQTKGYSNE